MALTKSWRTVPGRRNRRSSNNRINTIAVLALIVILVGILLFFTNIRQNQGILNSYCGDFGIYGQKLTLMKNGTFKFSYHGCSQVNGYLTGNWSRNKNVYSFFPIEPDELLDSKYQLIKNQLRPINHDFEQLTLCQNL